MAQGGRRGKRLEQKTERPGLLAAGRAVDDPLRGGVSWREVLNASPPSVRKKQYSVYCFSLSSAQGFKFFRFCGTTIR